MALWNIDSSALLSTWKKNESNLLLFPSFVCCRSIYLGKQGAQCSILLWCEGVQLIFKQPTYPSIWKEQKGRENIMSNGPIFVYFQNAQRFWLKIDFILLWVVKPNRPFDDILVSLIAPFLVLPSFIVEKKWPVKAERKWWG